jgi:hypothetical protein
MPEDIAYPPEQDEPGDPRIPALVEKIAIGRDAERILTEIAEDMYDKGELKNGNILYPGIIWEISVLGKITLWTYNLTPYLPAPSTPDASF